MNGIPAAIATLIVALPGLALAQPASPTGQHGRHVLRLIERIHAGSLTYQDASPPGPSLGDRLVYSADIFDRTGALVGRDGVDCVTVRIDPTTSPDKQSIVQCVATIELFSQGQIAAQSLAQGTSNVFAITGGTGRFRTARGEVLAEDVTPLVEANLTITLAGDDD